MFAFCSSLFSFFLLLLDCIFSNDSIFIGLLLIAITLCIVISGITLEFVESIFNLSHLLASNLRTVQQYPFLLPSWSVFYFVIHFTSMYDIAPLHSYTVTNFALNGQLFFKRDIIGFFLREIIVKGNIFVFNYIHSSHFWCSTFFCTRFLTVINFLSLAVIESFQLSEKEFHPHFFFFVKIFIYLAVPGLNCSMQDLLLQHVRSSSLTRDWTQAPALGAQSLSHWTTKEVPHLYFCQIFSLGTDL